MNVHLIFIMIQIYQNGFQADSPLPTPVESAVNARAKETLGANPGLDHAFFFGGSDPAVLNEKFKENQFTKCAEAGQKPHYV